jgi:sporulation protein YlmC with PRC-barrel domain
MHTQSPTDHGHHAPAFTGRPAIDEHGADLGTISDVVFDPSGNQPEYLVVDPGLFRSARYVPVAGAYETAEGTIVVPWDKHWFKLAPKAGGDHILTSVDRRLLEVHFQQNPRPVPRRL